MRSIALQTLDGDHLGFLLSSTDLQETRGDCIFMLLPLQAELCDVIAAEHLSLRCVAGESTWSSVSSESIAIVVQTPGIAKDLFVQLDESGSGEWGVRTAATRRTLGLAKLASPPPR